jgi:hypothetical protein
MPNAASSLSNSDKMAVLILILGSLLVADWAELVSVLVSAPEEDATGGELLAQLFKPTASRKMAAAMSK